MFCCNNCCRCCPRRCCCRPCPNPPEPPFEEREVTPEDLEIFQEALEGVVGVIYEPTHVIATRVEGGLEYRFTANASIPGPPDVVGPPWLVHIFIFVPLRGPVKLIDIVHL